MAQDGENSQRVVNRREFIRMTAGAIIALFLPGCQHTVPFQPMPVRNGWIDTKPYQKAGPWRIGRSGRGDISPWMIMLSAHIEYGIKEKYKQRFKEYFYTVANWDANKQIHDIKTLLARGIDLLLIDPLDDAVVATGVKEAMEKGIPVILASSAVRNAPYVSMVTVNEEKRGAICADWLCRVISDGSVVVLVSEPASGDSRSWLRAVQQRLAAQPNIRQISEKCFWSSSAAKEAMDVLFDSFPTIDGVVVNNGVLGQGVVQAFVEHGGKIPPIAGGDDWNGWLRTAKEYQVRFLGLSGGANLGLHCVDLATEVLSGHPVPAYVEFPYEIFDERAVDQYYRSDLSDYYWAIHDLPKRWIEMMFRL